MIDQALLYWALTGLALTVGSMGIYIAASHSKSAKEKQALNEAHAREVRELNETIKEINDSNTRKLEGLIMKGMEDSARMVTAVENNSKVMYKVLEMLKP